MSELPGVYESEKGHKTLIRYDLDETYHSRHGAIQESLHVFIQEGLLQYLTTHPTREISIFEMGFGTGLNAMLSFLESEKHQVIIRYTSIENLTLPYSLVQALDYQVAWDESKEDCFKNMHSLNWNQAHPIGEYFTLEKVHSGLEAYSPQQKFDLIYYDAFGPDKQPELWTLEVFEKLFSMLNKDGIFVTYASKGEVRRNLLAAGFRVEKIAGPLYKRHMLRAFKDQD